MDFVDLNIDELIDTVALSGAILEANLRKTQILSPHTLLSEGFAPESQIMVANGQLEALVTTFELQLQVADITFEENFILMTNLTRSLNCFLFLKRNSTIHDVRQAMLEFPIFSMPRKNEDRTYPSVIEPVPNPVETILQPGKRTIF